MLVVKQTNQPSLRVQAGELHEPATTETSDSDALRDSDVLTVIQGDEKPADVKVENTPSSTETIESVDFQRDLIISNLSAGADTQALLQSNYCLT